MCFNFETENREIWRLKRIKITWKSCSVNSFPHATDRIHVTDTPHSSYKLDNGDFTVAVQILTYFPYFTAIFTRARQCQSLSSARWIHPIHLPPLYLRAMWILSSHLCLDLPNDLSGFPTKTLYALFSSHVCYMPHPSHPPILNHPDNIWQKAQLTKYLIMELCW
jgi:hypothetical protein